MWPVMHHLGIPALQADALFVSGLQRCEEPSAGQVRQAITTAIRAFGRSGCAGRVAQEFGDHPETAVIRMRWACAMAGAAFAEPALQPGLHAEADELHVVRPGSRVKTYLRHFYQKLERTVATVPWSAPPPSACLHHPRRG